MKIFKITLAVLIVLSLLVPLKIRAEESSVSAEINKLVSSDSGGIEESSFAVGLRIENNPNQASAEMRKQSKIFVSNSDFQARQPILFEAANVKLNEFKVFIADDSKKRITISYDQEEVMEGVRIKLNPPLTFNPGKYTIQITDLNNNILAEKEIYWGNLNLNIKNSFIKVGDEAAFSIEALDENSDISCNADLSLTIEDPQGEKTILSTKENTIKSNEFCAFHRPVADSSYEATFKALKQGTYKINLKQSINNQTRQIEDSFEVKEDVALSVTRIMPSRIHVSKPYNFKFLIKANQDFEGTIYESVPDNFEPESMEIIPFSESSESGVLLNQVLGAKTSSLDRPFEGDYPVTLRFKDDYTDESIKEKLENIGVTQHDGIDFALPEKTEVMSVDDGQVTQVMQNRTSYGLTVVIQHIWGKTYYGHLNSALVKEGEAVVKGQVIALSGNTGISSGPHLHFAVEEENAVLGASTKVDPEFILPGIFPASFPQKIISWNVSLKKGENLELGYKVTLNKTQPLYYFLGKLKVVSKDGREEINEEKFYQLPVDRMSIQTLSQERPDFASENLIKILSVDGQSALLLENKITKYQSIWALDRNNGESWKKVATKDEIKRNTEVGLKDGNIFWLSNDGNALNGYNTSSNTYFSQTIDENQPELSKISINDNIQASHEKNKISFFNVKENEILESDDNEIENKLFAKDFLDNLSPIQDVAGAKTSLQATSSAISN